MTSRRLLPPGDWRLAVYGRSYITGAASHRRPTAEAKRRVRAQQGDVCLYCEIPIGTEILRGNSLVTLRRNWDHIIPHAYCWRNSTLNWAIACHICNRIKRSRMFDSVQAARDAILPDREAKGYEPVLCVLRRINRPVAADGEEIAHA